MKESASRLGACYIRVSTEEQTEYSPDSQLREIKEFAYKNHIILLDKHIYIDAGISGRKAGRPAFQQMIAAAKTHPRPFDVVLVYKYSRFARDRESSIVYKNILRKQCGISVISVKEPLDDGDKMSILMESVIEAMDEFYSLNLAEDVRRTQKEKHLRGEPQCAPAFGYRITENRLIPHEQEALIVKEIFRRFINGEGYYTIACYLNQIGIRTHRGNKFENRAIEYIIRNPVYIGKLRRMPLGKTRRDYDNPNLIIVPGQHQPIIDDATWSKAQELARALKKCRRPYSKPAESKKSWLSGLLRCGNCGKPMVSNGAAGGFICSAYSKGSCPLRNHIQQQTAENFVIAQLQHDLKPSATIAFRRLDSATTADNASILKSQLESLTKKSQRLREAYLAGVESIEEYGAAKALLDQEAAAAREQLTELNSTLNDQKNFDQLPPIIDNAALLLQDSHFSLGQKNALISQLIDKISYDSRNNHIKIYYRLYLEPTRQSCRESQNVPGSDGVWGT